MIADLSVRPAPAPAPTPAARPAAERNVAAPDAGPPSSSPALEARPTGRSAGPPANAAAEDATEAAAERLRSMLTDPELRVQTRHDPASGRTVMQFQDRSTGDVVEQLPSDTLLKLYAAIREPLIDRQA